MEREKISEEELKEQGWKYILTYGYTLKAFKKGNKNIFWDSKTQKIIHKYEEDKD